MPRETYNYKRSAIVAARDLCYGEDVINRLKKSTDANEIARIMATARKSC